MFLVVLPTEDAVFTALNEEFHFTTDVCATTENARCTTFYTLETDGLKQKWTGSCWMNPPYGRMIGRWMHKARVSSDEGATVVCLVPARTDTAWWHDEAMNGEIRFCRGRLRFNGHTNSAPFPSAVVIFRPPLKRRRKKPDEEPVKENDPRLFKKAREGRNITQAEMSQRSCIPQSTISRVESGQIIPDLVTVAALLDALGANLDVLATRQSQKLCVKIDRRQPRNNHQLNDGTLPY